MKIRQLQHLRLWGKSITVNKYNWRPERFIIWWVSGSLLSPLGVPAWPLVAIEFWLGVVSTFFWRAFFLLDTGVRGGGSANRSTSLLCAATFSLFSVVLSLSLLSWQCCGVLRPLSEVRLEAHFLSTDGDTSFFRKEKRWVWQLVVKMWFYTYSLPFKGLIRNILNMDVGCRQQ